VTQTTPAKKGETVVKVSWPLGSVSLNQMVLFIFPTMQMMRMNLKKFSSHVKQISHMPRKTRITVQGSHGPEGSE
jgi:hypothetical protein